MSYPTHCHICKAPDAPFWFRRPGMYSDLPSAERGRYLCACADCRDEVRRRRDARFAAGLPARPAASPAPPAPDRPPRSLPGDQPGLFD